MGLPVLIMGESGAGKTYSLKNFESEDAPYGTCKVSGHYECSCKAE